MLARLWGLQSQTMEASRLSRESQSRTLHQIATGLLPLSPFAFFTGRLVRLPLAWLSAVMMQKHGSHDLRPLKTGYGDGPDSRNIEHWRKEIKIGLVEDL